MNDLIVAIITYFILLSIALYSNYGISKMNERYDKTTKRYEEEGEI